jgi:hypothetical protein
VRPYDPQLCGYVLLACVEILFEEPVGKAATKAAVKKLDLNPVLDAFVVFFCAPRSKVELQALHERTACHCDLDEVREDESAQHLHALGMKCFLEALQHHQLHPLHPILTTVLTKVWARCNMRWRRKEPKLYRTGLQPLTSCPAGSEWPQSMYQLLPYGPEDTMRGFIQWLASWVKLDLNTRVQMLIWVDALAIACHTEVIPYIITSRTLLAALIDMLGAIIDDWRPNAPKEDHRVLGPFVSVIGRHLNTLKDGMTPVEWAAFVAPFAADVVRRCDAMIPLCTDLASKVERPALTEVLYKETLPSFIIVGCGAYGRHPEAHPVIGDVSNIIRRGSVFSVKERDPWFRLLVHIRILHRRRRCCAPDCRRTWADLRQSAKLCQGCRQVQYCSITCQKVSMGASQSVVVLLIVRVPERLATRCGPPSLCLRSASSRLCTLSAEPQDSRPPNV